MYVRDDRFLKLGNFHLSSRRGRGQCPSFHQQPAALLHPASSSWPQLQAEGSSTFRYHPAPSPAPSPAPARLPTTMCKVGSSERLAGLMA